MVMIVISSMLHANSAGILFWDPDPTFFHLPLIERPIAWYGVIFALGLALCYQLLRRRGPEIGLESKSLEQLTTWTIAGLICGARLFHVLFYDLPLYLAHPLDIFKVWEGGLASHGGVVGALLAIALFARRNKITTLRLLDLIAPLGLLLGAWIRLGNFVNQEILGAPSTLPWAVVFGHPIDGSLPLPRHPVQLYEAVLYGGIFLLSWSLWRRAKSHSGFITGLVLSLAFSGRIALETFKEPMSQVYEGGMHMGAWLSVPVVVAGLLLLSRSRARSGF